MSREAAEAEMREALGLVPSFFSELPDYLIESEWGSFKQLQLAEHVIPGKYKELIGLGVAGATRCRYCAYYHTEVAKLFGATDVEIAEAVAFAKASMGWSTFLNGMQVDYEGFRAELDQITAHVRAGAATAG